MQAEAYSYRADPQVPKFDDSRPLLIFDGHCVLCSDGVNWMLDRDPEGTSRFAAIQEPIPRALYRHYDLDADRFDTFMVLADGRPYLRWAGALAAARTMAAPWSMARLRLGVSCRVSSAIGSTTGCSGTGSTGLARARRASGRMPRSRTASSERDRACECC